MDNIMPDKPSKKYPVIYEGNEYEVRWKTNFFDEEILSVYEVYLKRRFFTKKNIKKRRRIYSVTSDVIIRECNRLELPTERHKYILYIHVLMVLMMTAKGREIKARQLEQKSLETLNNWDGNLDTWDSKKI